MKEVQKKYLLVKGCAGIGNRIFSLASAIKYAQKTNRIIVVDWRDGVFTEPSKNAFPVFFKLKEISNLELNDFLLIKRDYSCYPLSYKKNIDKNLYDLFIFCSSKYLKKIPGIHKLRGRLSRLSEFWMYSDADNFGQNRISDILSLKSLLSDKHLEFGHKLSESLNEDVVVFADYWPSNIENKYLDHIDFTSDFKDNLKIKILELGIKSDTIGIHVRFADKKPTKDLDKLIAYLDNCNASSMFLCTDNVTIEGIFKEKFGIRLIVLPKFFPKKESNENMHHWSMKNNDYSNVEQIYEESLLDVSLLASCQKILYQGNSSYSKLALAFNKNNAETINWLTL